MGEISLNEAIYIITDSIQLAIIDRKKICFQYFDYGIDGKPIFRNNGNKYIVSPFDLVWSNDTYYLAGLHEKKAIVAKFRVDRIKNLELNYFMICIDNFIHVYILTINVCLMQISYIEIVVSFYSICVEEIYGISVVFELLSRLDLC